jgi:hypothetical protein
VKTSKPYAKSYGIEIPLATGGSCNRIPVRESEIAKESTPTASL